MLGFDELLPSHDKLVEWLGENRDEFRQLGIDVDECSADLRSATFNRSGREENGVKSKFKTYTSLRRNQLFASDVESEKLLKSKGVLEKFASLESNELNALLGIYVMEPETVEAFQRKALSIILDALTVDPDDPAYVHIITMPKEGLVGTKMWMDILEEYDRASIHDVRVAEENLFQEADTFDENLRLKKQQIMRKYREYERIYRRCSIRRPQFVAQHDVALRVAAAMSASAHGERPGN